MMEEKEKLSLGDKVKAIANEYKKISWPKRDLLVKQTISVITFSLLIGSIVFIYDICYNFLFDFVNRI